MAGTRSEREKRIAGAATLALVLILGCGAFGTASARAGSAYVVEQRQGSNRSVLTLAAAGLRYETLAPERAGGLIRSKHAKAVLAWQIVISASKGSLRANSSRSCARVTGRRITKVPAAPMLTASRCFSCWASVVGRKIL